MNGKMPNSKQWKIPTWETRDQESWLDSAPHPSKSFSKMRALDNMKSKVFVALWLSTEEILINEHELPNTIHEPVHHGTTAFPPVLCPALHTLLCFDGPPPRPEPITGPIFIISLQVMRLNHYYVFWLCFLILARTKQWSSSTFTLKNPSDSVQAERKRCSF